MIIESTPAIANAPIEEVYSYLRNVSNLYYLLPLDKIKDWEASTEYCSFKVQGGIIIPMEYLSESKPTQLVLKSGSKSPFPFTLTVNLSQVENTTRGSLVFDAKVSKMIQLIAEKPLRNLFETMALKLTENFSQEK
jgi:carbon monoxide dehydrogenase subunit G